MFRPTMKSYVKPSSNRGTYNVRGEHRYNNGNANYCFYRVFSLFFRQEIQNVLNIYAGTRKYIYLK